MVIEVRELDVNLDFLSNPETGQMLTIETLLSPFSVFSIRPHSACTSGSHLLCCSFSMNFRAQNAATKGMLVKKMLIKPMLINQ